MHRCILRLCCSAASHTQEPCRASPSASAVITLQMINVCFSPFPQQYFSMTMRKTKKNTRWKVTGCEWSYVSTPTKKELCCHIGNGCYFNAPFLTSAPLNICSERIWHTNVPSSKLVKRSAFRLYGNKSWKDLFGCVKQSKIIHLAQKLMLNFSFLLWIATLRLQERTRFIAISRINLGNSKWHKNGIVWME